LAVEIQLGTGLRIGEVCGLRWDHIDLDEGRVFVEFTMIRKTGEGLCLSDVKVSDSERWLYLPSYLVDLLRAHQEEFGTEDGMVLHSPTGGWLDPVHAQRDLRRVFADLGWEGVTSHTLRRTAAARLIEAGRPVTEVASQLGHRGVATTIRSYIAVSQTGPQSAREVLDR
jgi:integrase